MIDNGKVSVLGVQVDAVDYEGAVAAHHPRGTGRQLRTRCRRSLCTA